MAKFCMCGQQTCPICKGKPAEYGVPQVTGSKPRRKPVYQFGANATVPTPNESVPIPPTVESTPNVTVPPENTSVRIAKLDRLTASTTEEIMAGIHHVPCGCGCGKMVKVGPVYASSACRSRAWRKKKAE